ncbi:MAG: DNA topoisomerase IB [Phenylobacterium sp.]|jgi:DNA topoisomerase-1|uniref:DNA topoisomerase IB n=1 Tax=Phenylobacterium sp. TaxID=1871053 RepID=UPI001B5B7A40|nr:DNA topoisomerase IB [Phenylobacterium sp.]MBP7651317.1 DNA topoisomerase IB [Phenylobacterium sp.]MBP7817509.1 DNA topoisomerase IB [Phenylobacterium sp.]MBP9230245.1 DNA topoisomerase IB [Phenylobacterium sp.]MBP9753850.1 DNA topoisomerase IB [Phenylobacterium sp.]
MARDTAELTPPAPVGLTYVNDDDAGITRIKAGDGFTYRDTDRRPVRDVATLARIKALVIPPAWTDVWICPSARGHIQATGRDQKGRKQYRYHSDWRQDRDLAKYERVIAFGRALPRLRKRVKADLARRGLPREKVLAAVVAVMEMTLIRVGNEEYARANKSFGLTTLRDRHARVTTSGAVFEFRGKSGKVHQTGFRDRRLARIVKACQEIPGQRLFQYIGDDGQRRAVESADVNTYIREVLGDDFSAKDFRTWAGTLTAARGLVMHPPAASAAEAKRNVATCVKAVAGLLGNTAAVCKGSYIHPLVLESYERGVLPLKGAGSARAFELSVLKFLEAARDCAA